jgi:hypothetical protein
MALALACTSVVYGMIAQRFCCLLHVPAMAAIASMHATITVLVDCLLCSHRAAQRG